MKTIKILSSIILFVTAIAANAQSNEISSAGNYGFILYQASFDANNGCHNIKFNINEDCYTVMFAIDSQTNEKIMLVDGDISTGQHGVMFKHNRNSYIYTCILEAYNEKGELLHTSNITLQ